MPHVEALIRKHEIFVVGGAGGVGSFAVQIAVAIGARVVASARAEDVIDYTQSDVVTMVRSITNGAGADAATRRERPSDSG